MVKKVWTSIQISPNTVSGFDFDMPPVWDLLALQGPGPTDSVHCVSIYTLFLQRRMDCSVGGASFTREQVCFVIGCAPAPQNHWDNFVMGYKVLSRRVLSQRETHEQTNDKFCVVKLFPRWCLLRKKICIEVPTGSSVQMAK